MSKKRIRGIMRSYQEKRFFEQTMYYEEELLVRISFRKNRNIETILCTWDDKLSRYHNNWKLKRKTQYRHK